MLIVAFWLGMTSLLVVRELYPESTRLNDVPVNHVGRLFFQHEQGSDLVIRDKQKEVGYLHVQPRRDRESGARRVEFHGNVGLNLPAAGKKRLSWSGNMSMDDTFNVTRLRIALSTHDPIQGVELDVDAVTNVAKYVVTHRGNELEKGSFTLDQNGLTSLLERAGLPVALFKSLLSSQKASATPEVVARQATLKINGEEISAYTIAVNVSGQTMFEAHVTQLGQVLKAKAAALGYTLAPHTLKTGE
jgi:hypothetical protein